MALNVTTAVFGEDCNTATASPSLAQWDTEQILQISGVELPDSYKVEFSTVYTRNAIPAIGDASGVTIPNVLLQRSAPITAYVVLYGENGGRNREYWITIHITPGQPPETITPDPEQEDVIDQAIAALNNGVARTEAAATAAAVSATEADGNAENAEAWAVGQRAGEDVPDTDPTYRNNAKYYAGAAEAAAEEAGQHEASWESWVRRAEAAADDAEGSARAAAGSKADATAAAQTATQKATEAGNSAGAAAGSASEARRTVDGAIGAINTARDGALNAIGSAGSNAVGAVEQAGAMQTGRVTTEGNTQVNRVQTKGDEVIGSIPPDYSDLADDVADLSRQLNDETTGLDTKAPVILETASGAIASFDDGADGMPIKKLVAQIEPVQDLHGYDHPWPAGGMGNLAVDTLIGNAPSITHNGVTLTVKGGKFVTSGTATASGGRLQLRTDPFTLPAGTYTASQSGYNGDIFVQRQSGNSIIVAFNNAGNVFTLEEDTAVFIGFNVNTDGTYNFTTEILINTGSTKGTWYPYSNECPISGWTGAEIEQRGKNLLDPTTKLFDTTGSNMRFFRDVGITLPQGTYTLSYKGGSNISGLYVSYFPEGSGVAAFVYNTDKLTFTLATEKKLFFNFYDANNRLIDDMSYYQLEVGSTATAYEPYTGNQISVTFPSAAGTVYGGTLTINPDRTGTLVVDREMITFNGSESWLGSSYTFGLTLQSKNFVNIIPKCDYYNGVSARAYTGLNTGECALTTTYQSINFKTIYENIADFKSALNSSNVHVVLGRVNPQVIQLTAEQISGILTTLYGQNNIWCDTGDVEVTYPADTKLYIDGKLAEIQATILENIGG